MATAATVFNSREANEVRVCGRARVEAVPQNAQSSRYPPEEVRVSSPREVATHSSHGFGYILALPMTSSGVRPLLR